MGNSVITPINNIKDDIENNIEKNNDDNCGIYEKWDKYLKTFNNVDNNADTKKNIKGIIYKNKDEYGDFNWMIESGSYKNTLFIFDDNVDEYYTCIEGNGLSKIRKYNEFGKYEKISSAGIIMCSSYNNGFSKLDSKTKNIIDRCIGDIKRLVMEYGYNEIYFSSDEDGNIKPNCYNINNEVIKYVSDQIFLLNNLLEKV